MHKNQFLKLIIGCLIRKHKLLIYRIVSTIIPKKISYAVIYKETAHKALVHRTHRLVTRP